MPFSSSIISESDLDNALDRFIHGYSNEIPSSQYYLGSRVTIAEVIIAREMGRKINGSETAAHCINWRGHAS